MTGPAAIAVFGLLVGLAADEGATPGPLMLEVSIDAGLTDRNLGAALLDHLRAELAATNVTVTTAGAPGGSRANARLTVGPVRGNPRAISLEIQYLRSGAAVQRTLDLSSVPPDGALLAVAVAVDELLRASWSLSGVEANPPRPMSTLPPPNPALPPPEPPRAEARLLMAGERQSGGHVTLGPDVVVAVALGSRVGIDVRGGWRHAGSRPAADGVIDSSAVIAGVGASVALPARAEAHRAGAELAARIDGAWVSMQGTARSGATAYSTTALGVAAVGGVGGWVTLIQPLRLVAFVGWQVPLRSVSAGDGNQSAGVLFHPGFSAAAGIGARF
jgi:hypothetical protein